MTPGEIKVVISEYFFVSKFLLDIVEIGSQDGFNVRATYYAIRVLSPDRKTSKGIIGSAVLLQPFDGSEEKLLIREELYSVPTPIWMQYLENNEGTTNGKTMDR